MTLQTSERLFINGERSLMNSFPPIPSQNPRISYQSTLDAVMNTGCVRGYIGSWEIRFNRLYLVGLEGAYQLIGTKPLFASWFSGVLSVPIGKPIKTSVFQAMYDEFRNIQIENGKVVSDKRVKSVRYQ